MSTTAADVDTTPTTTHLDVLFEEWAAWSASRQRFGAPRIAAGLLGKLTARTRPLGTGPNGPCSASMSALNLAIAAQPDDLSRAVFLLHYVHRVGNIKTAAAALGIGRATWYRHLTAFRERAHAAHLRILEVNLAAGMALPHRAEEKEPPH